MSEFVGDEIEVRFGKELGPPTAFIWRGREYKIAEIKGRRRVLDFRKAWWRRRHRDYFVAKTETGDTFELYCHRGPGKRYWVLYRRLEE